MAWAVWTILCLAGLWATRGWQQRTGTTLFARRVALLCAGFSLLDWGLLSALRPLGISFGPTALAFLTLGVARVFLAASLVFSQRRTPAAPAADRPVFLWGRPFSRRAVTAMAVLLALNLGLTALTVDAFYVEPRAVGVTELTLPAPDFLGDRPLRIVHLTDLHIEYLTSRERGLPARVAALQPDLIVLTGDYLNQEYVYDSEARQAARGVLAQLHAPLGMYAVDGTVDVPEAMSALFGGLDITVLDNEVRRLALPGGDLYLAGVSSWAGAPARVLTDLMQDVPAGAYTLLLHHMPDLIETAAGLGVNLYLAGHTHGGQIRLPVYGAIITFSTLGKRFEMGQYQVGPTTLYVSRGIGLEGLGLPRVRFLCPPELEVISLSAGR